jgi:hypothetical protein
MTTKSGHNKLLSLHFGACFVASLVPTPATSVPTLETISFTTLLCAARLFEFTACIKAIDSAARGCTGSCATRGTYCRSISRLSPTPDHAFCHHRSRGRMQTTRSSLSRYRRQPVSAHGCLPCVLRWGNHVRQSYGRTSIARTSAPVSSSSSLFCVGQRWSRLSIASWSDSGEWHSELSAVTACTPSSYCVIDHATRVILRTRPRLPFSDSSQTNS